MRRLVVDADGPRVEFGTHIVRSTMHDPWWPWWTFTHRDRIEFTRLRYVPVLGDTALQGQSLG